MNSADMYVPKMRKKLRFKLCPQNANSVQDLSGADGFGYGTVRIVT